MSSMMSDAQDPSAQAQGAAQSGSYPTQNDPAFSVLGQAAQLIQQFIQQEKDPQLQADGAKLLAQCHAIISGGEKNHDAALGLSPALKFVQRQKAMQQGQDQGGY